MKHEEFVNSWLQSKIQKVETEKRQNNLQNEKIKFIEEKVATIRENIYEPLEELIAEMNNALSELEDETINQQKVQLTQLLFQENRYVSFGIIDGKSQLNFQFEVISPENYNINTCKQLGLKLDYLNARDCDVYPKYRTDKIIWWGIISGNAGMGINILYCEKQNTAQRYIKIVKKEVIRNDGILENFQTFNELYKKAMYGWSHTAITDYNIGQIKMLINMNGSWSQHKK